MLKLKEGQTYICTKADYLWWSVGREYPVVVDSSGKLALQDNNGTYWNEWLLRGLATYFTLKESEPIKHDVEIMYTKEEVNKQIAKVHQKFDNDSQRLAYLMGYFAK